MSDELRVFVICKVPEINQRRQVLVDRLRPGQKEQYAAIPKLDKFGFCVWEMTVEMAREYIAGRLSTKHDFQYALYKSEPMWAEVRNPDGTTEWREFKPVYAEKYSVLVPDKSNPREDVIEWRTRFIEYSEGPFTKENCVLDNKERQAPAVPAVKTEYAPRPAPSAAETEAAAKRLATIKQAREPIDRALGKESVDAFIAVYCKSLDKQGCAALTDPETEKLVEQLQAMAM